MSKAILEFNLEEPSDVLSFKRATKATDAYLALFDIANSVFRPARKHGYSFSEQFMNVEEWSDETHAVVEKLEQTFFGILEEHEVNIYEDLE